MDNKNERSKKSVAKANGLKSVFSLGNDQYFVTSFGKGNTAQAEKDIKDKNVSDIKTPETFSAQVTDNDKLLVTGKRNHTAETASVQLPKKDKNRLQAKSVIEQIFFGKAFDDNIHIQIAYKVMDIKKLFAVYANNIIYTINNLFHSDFDEYESYRDSLGIFGTMNSFQSAAIASSIIKTGLIKHDRSNKFSYYFIDMSVWNANKDKSLSSLNRIVKKYSSKNLKYHENISKCIVEQLGFDRLQYIESAADVYNDIQKFGYDKCVYYFSDIFAGEESEANLDYIYEIVRLLGVMRQTSFHSDDLETEENRIKNTYTLFEIDKKAPPETRTILNKITANKLDKLNNNFVKTSTVNLNILFKAYPKKARIDVIKEYYDFSVRKVQKNIGFSVKNLRENLIANIELLKSVEDEKYNSVRSKLYSLIDFVIFNYYVENSDAAENFVTELRQIKANEKEIASGVTNDDKKLSVYRNEAVNNLWQNIENTVINIIIPAIDKCKSGKIDDFNNVIDESLKEEIDSITVKPKELSYFSKAIYCICAFLDKKEVNMFLDGIINNLDNITSLKEVVSDIIPKGIENCGSEAEFDAEIKFTDSYSFFDSCDKYVSELRFIKSIAKMNQGKKAIKNSDIKVKSFQYFEAAAILGETDTEKVTSVLRLKEKGDRKNKVHVFRNFIINNVINSNRYNYIIRFMNPADARKFMQNEALVSFAVKEIDDKQIIRYAESIKLSYDAKKPNLDEMRAEISKKLLQIDFDTFAKVSNDPREAVEKEKLKALIGLYLTIAYLIIKSIVRINTSYSIGFGIFERDCMIMRKKAELYPNDENVDLIRSVSIQNHPINMLEYFKKSGRINDRIINLTARNNSHYDDDTFKYIRNNVEHLTVVAKFPMYVDEITQVETYFDLYHYILFCVLMDGYKGNCSIKREATLQGEPYVSAHQSAYKDFLYGILAPLAYSPARYINLACKNKFIESYGK